MKTLRDSVERFLFLHIENYLNQNISAAEYAGEHGLKKASMHPWVSRYREKFPEKFKENEFFSESETKSISLSESLAPTNSFIEIRGKPKDLKNNKIAETVKLKIQDLGFEFFTVPDVEWIKDFHSYCIFY